jgi:hypothetical protein
MQPGLVGCLLGVGWIFYEGNFPSAVRFAGQLEGDGSKLVTTDDMQRVCGEFVFMRLLAFDINRDSVSATHNI